VFGAYVLFSSLVFGAYSMLPMTVLLFCHGFATVSNEESAIELMSMS